jgi:gamma-glutamyltranspeptidase/glutathione hydrolase
MFDILVRVEVYYTRSKPMRGVIACAEPYGAEAGLRIFQQGGNAVDAAVAAAFAQGVTNPLGVGIGGLGVMLVYHAQTQKCTVIDGSVTIPSGASPTVFASTDKQEDIGSRAETVGRYVVKDDINQYGYKSIMVPGFVRGVYEAYRLYGSGRTSWADLLQPAIRLARDGFTVYPYLAEYYTFEGPSRPAYPNMAFKMRTFPQTAKLLYKDGRPFRCDEVMLLTDMACTLEKIADGGADIFYTGEIGQVIAADFQRNDGFLTAEDLHNYRARVRQPVRGTYRGYEIVSSPPPDRGLTVIQMLQILEGYNLKEIGWNTPRYIDLLARVQRCSFADTARHLVDPDFANVPIDMLASKEHAAAWRQKIESREDDGTPGSHSYPQPEHTTHVTAVDGEGNVAACTHSIGSVAGSGVITPGLGFVYNNFLGHFNPVPGYPNSIEPGKRGGGGTPTIVFKEGKPFLAIGSSGGSRLVSAVVQSITNVIDHDMGMAEAVVVPRFHCEQDNLLFVEPNIFAAVIQDLEDLGYQVQRSNYMGCNQAVLIEPSTGRLEGGTDPRGGRGLTYCVE